MSQHAVVDRPDDAPSSLPVYNPSAGGKSGCISSDCPSYGNRSVVHVDAVEDMFRRNKIERNFEWPVPDYVTHICTRCGFWYSGRAKDITEW